MKNSFQDSKHIVPYLSVIRRLRRIEAWTLELLWSLELGSWTLKKGVSNG